VFELISSPFRGYWLFIFNALHVAIMIETFNYKDLVQPPNKDPTCIELQCGDFDLVLKVFHVHMAMEIKNLDCNHFFLLHANFKMPKYLG
jgi:hypothetical protein